MKKFVFISDVRAVLSLLFSGGKKKKQKKKSRMKSFQTYFNLIHGVMETAEVQSALQKAKQMAAKHPQAGKKSAREQEKKNAVTIEQAEMIEL